MESYMDFQSLLLLGVCHSVRNWVGNFYKDMYEDFGRRRETRRGFAAACILLSIPGDFQFNPILSHHIEYSLTNLHWNLV